jgi:hypothetical protein
VTRDDLYASKDKRTLGRPMAPRLPRFTRARATCLSSTTRPSQIAKTTYVTRRVDLPPAADLGRHSLHLRPIAAPTPGQRGVAAVPRIRWTPLIAHRENSPLTRHNVYWGSRSRGAKNEP